MRLPILIIAVAASSAACRNNALPLESRYAPAFAADPEAAVNGAIAFAAPTGGPVQIFTMNADGSSLTQLTTDSRGGVSPAWSPNGQRIAFNRVYDIYVMNADGSELTQISPTDPNTGAYEPVWSPDGQQIAFSTDGRDARSFGISVMNADGSGARALTTPVCRTSCDDQVVSADRSPSWSPDGKRIAFVRRMNDAVRQDVFIMNADGSEITQITHSDPFVAFFSRPDWSPNGKRITFGANRDLAGNFTNSAHVFTMNPDGTGMLQLASGASPAWSPSGRRIVFSAEGGLFIMNEDGSDVTQVSAAGFGPAWTARPLHP